MFLTLVEFQVLLNKRFLKKSEFIALNIEMRGYF